MSRDIRVAADFEVYCNTTIAVVKHALAQRTKAIGFATIRRKTMPVPASLCNGDNSWMTGNLVRYLTNEC